jgi:hypothetical protein
MTATFRRGPETALLAQMRQISPYATLVDYMLLNGELFRRCPICRCGPVPRNAYNVMWCDDCLTEADNSRETLEEFIARKRAMVPIGNLGRRQIEHG